MTKIILEYNEKSHPNFENHFQGVSVIFNDTITEFKKLNVDTKLSFEDLKQGDFIKIFHKYHESQHKKFYKAFLYDKYIENCGLDTTHLQELEDRYKVFLNGKFDFYKLNNSFYSYSKHRTRDFVFAEIMKSAPTIKTYTLFDFVKISKDKIIVNVPKELFMLYAENKKQIVLIEDIKNYVQASRALNIERKHILEPINKFVKDLSTDLETIEFNYNSILTVK